VLNAAARLVSGTRKFDRGLSRLLHVDLHWLDVPEHVQYKLGVTVRRCQQHKTPQYPIGCVTPASDIASRQRLRSATRHQLLVPRYQLSLLLRRSFAVAGPKTWNSLSADLRDPTCNSQKQSKDSQNSKNDHWCTNRHMSTQSSPNAQSRSRRCAMQIHSLLILTLLLLTFCLHRSLE